MKPPLPIVTSCLTCAIAPVVSALAVVWIVGAVYALACAVVCLLLMARAANKLWRAVDWRVR